VEQAIDTSKESLRLQALRVQTAFFRVDLKTPSLKFIFLTSVAQQLIANSPNAPQLSPAKLAQLQVKSVVAGVGIDDAGLRMKAIANIDPEANNVEYQPSPARWWLDFQVTIASFPDRELAVTGQRL